MSDLPNREDKLLMEKQALEIIDAYMDGELKSRDEMDEEAAASFLEGRVIGRRPRSDGPERAVRAVLDAAWGVADSEGQSDE